jgi:4-amino-4-deoxy-L-arabinose transferase-like glycosyltransferase
MKRPRILLLGLVAYLLFCYGYVLLFYSSPLPTLKEKTGHDWTRLALLFQLVSEPFVRPGDLWESWFGVPGEFALRDRLPVLLIAGTILGCATALGWLLMALCRADRDLSRLEVCVFSAAVGLSAVSTYVLAAGLLGWLRHPAAFAAPAALTLAAAGWLRWRRATAAATQDRHSSPPARSVAGAQDDAGPGPRWLWLGIPFVLIILLGGMLPPVDFDVREYHLQVPKEFFQQGWIGFLPHNVYGNMPMGTEMHSLLGMVIAGDWWLGALAGKTVIAAMAPLTALALLAAGRRFFSTAAGVVAALVYISIPWIAHVSTAGLVEGASAYYLLLSVYAVLIYGQGGEEIPLDHNPARRARAVPEDNSGKSPRPSGRGRPYLLLAGYLAGGAVSCKYPAVLFVVLPLAAWLLLRNALGSRDEPPPGRDEAQRSPTGRPEAKKVGLPPGLESGGQKGRLRRSLRAGKPVGIFLLAALVGCGLWFGKNWALTGNPTYPLLYGVFGGKTRTFEKNRQWLGAHRPHDFSAAALVTDLARVGLRSEWLSPLVVPLAVLALLDRRRRRVIGLLAYFGYVVGAWWLLTHRIDRFWIPALPLLALLAGAGACWSRQRWWRRGLIGVLVLGLAVNLPVADFAVGYARYFVSLDHLRRDTDRVDPWHLYLNTHVRRGRVLMVGDAQVFDLEVPVLYSTCFDDCLLEQLLRRPSQRGLRPPEEIRAALAARDISYIYVDWGEIARYRSPGNYGFTDFVRPWVFERLVKDAVLQPLPEIKGHPGRGYRVLTR